MCFRPARGRTRLCFEGSFRQYGLSRAIVSDKAALRLSQPGNAFEAVAVVDTPRPPERAHRAPDIRNRTAPRSACTNRSSPRRRAPPPEPYDGVSTESLQGPAARLQPRTFSPRCRPEAGRPRSTAITAYPELLARIEHPSLENCKIGHNGMTQWKNGRVVNYRDRARRVVT